MKAVVLRPPASLDALRVTDIPDPGQPKAGEIRVRMRASSLNFHDYALALGKLPLAGDRIALGEGSGEVEALGDGVTDFAPGDHVVTRYLPTWIDGEPTLADFSTAPGDGVDGFACEVVVRPAAGFTRAPRGWTHAEAATVPVAALTAWRALVVEGRLKGGDSVLVLGTGGVSIYALQIAKAMGARVFATTSSEDKRSRLLALGAEAVVNYKETPDWGRAIIAATGGRGVDQVVEVGGPGTLGQSLTAVRIGGHVTMVGILTGFAGEVPTALMSLKQVGLKGIVVGNRSQQVHMVRALEAAELRPVIDRTIGLDALAEGFRHQSTGAHFGKICVTW